MASSVRVRGLVELKASLAQLGEVVGRLHAIPPASPNDPFLSRRAGSLPREDLAFGRSCLARVAGRIPSERLREFDALSAALEVTNDCEDLPGGLIHPDGHLANALRTPAGRLVLFDWDGAGQGLRIAALGLLLFSCAVQAPEEPFVPPDLSRVDAVLAGYQRHYTLSSAELDRLPDAVRFRPLVIAARTLAASIEKGEAGDVSGWWSRYAEADRVAARARNVVLNKV
jgi:Ser/Thr protein kinase RdoA (MazF antagonist)